MNLYSSNITYPTYPSYTTQSLDQLQMQLHQASSNSQTDLQAKGAQAVAAATGTMQTAGKDKTKKKRKKNDPTIRTAAGEIWEDESLAEWPQNDHRIFVGDLGNECNDDHLIKAFSKYPSFAKAKVVRDHKTLKSKGYGFVSFMDPEDFMKAMKEMNGKYIGNRPVKLRKSTWQDRGIANTKNKGLKLLK
eukprot:c15334_g1_i1.p1 GENE.c15334_g1_i1~~c15334_g1_i1.p1  ORF type:complete len:190 (+),score=72.18 c15334_g1_i1:307-876(+)